MRTTSKNKSRKSTSKPKRPSTTKYNHKVSPNILASDETKKIYQKLNAYPNNKFTKQLNTEKLTLYLNNYSLQDINVISKILSKYLYFQQLTIGPFEPPSTQPANPQSNFNQQNMNYQKKRTSKSSGKVYKSTKQKESERIQIKQKIFSALQKHLSLSKSLLSLVIQSFKINQELAKYLSEGIFQNKSLQYLSINNCVISVDVYEIILKGILNHEIIRCLDLSNNKLNDKYSSIITRIIQRQAQRRDQIVWSYQLRNELPNDNNYKLGLISITLHGNKLGKQSAELISNALVSDQYIRYIDLSKNDFDNTSCKLFIHMMRKNNTLLTVDLRENPGYDEFINPRIVMKMSKNIRNLYSQYQERQYTEEEFEYLKGFIDISFFDVDIPQEIVEYYNTNVEQTTNTNGPSELNQNNNFPNNENQNMNNINNANMINNNIQEENEEEQAVIKNNEYNNNINNNANNNQNNNQNINQNKIKNNKNNNKENSKAYKENQKLIQENLQLKQEILELKAKNLQKMLTDGLVVPKEEEKDLENYYNRANEIIDTLNEVMAKLQQHKSTNNNNQNNLNNYDLNSIKEKANNIINQNNNNSNSKDNNNNIDQNEIINKVAGINNNSMNNNINQIDNNNDEQNNNDSNNIINNVHNDMEQNNNNNMNKMNMENNNKNNLMNEEDLKEENEQKSGNKQQNDNKIIENKSNENNQYNNNNENNENNMNISDEEENDFNFDDLTEEEKIALIQQRELLLKLQAEAEARGEQFNIQEYLAQLEEQAEEDEFGQQGQNDNKLNKSF